MFLERHYQNAYVTSDLDRALDALQERLGAARFNTVQAETPVWSPQGEGVAVTRIALGWIGDLQYELIQPISGAVELYQEGLRPDRLLNFHHIAMRADDWDQVRSEIERQKLPVVLEGTTAHVRFVYVDARDTLGHYLEYMWGSPELWASFGR